MTRSTKIRIALALVVLGALAWAVWPGEEKEEVSITFAGVSTTNSLRLLFTITNGSKKSFNYGLAAESQTNGTWPEPYTSRVFLNGGGITNQSARTVVYGADETNRWRWIMVYWDATAIPFAAQARGKLGRKALNNGWPRLATWIFPHPKLKTVYGPEMLGNQPAPLAQ